VSGSYLLFTPGGGCGIVLQYDATSPFKQASFAGYHRFVQTALIAQGVLQCIATTVPALV
jgi:hypothetical protein